MNKAKIEWVKNPDGTPGYTWNPITGCLNHVNGYCKGGNFPCYAYRLANGRLKSIYWGNHNVAFPDGKVLKKLELEQAYNDPFYPRFWEERFVLADKILKASKEPLGVFPCDMSDWCGIGIPYEWSNMLYCFMLMHKRHRFYLLTKQPQNLPAWSPFPDNCWVGVTATNQKAHNEAVVVLSGIKAGKKFISHEPLLERISLHSLYSPEDAYDWDIIGSQTRPYRPPTIQAVREIVEACDKAKLPVFLKENLRTLMLSELFSTKQWAWHDNKLRQEMPGHVLGEFGLSGVSRPALVGPGEGRSEENG